MAVQSHITLMMKMNACMIFIAYINHRFLFCHRKTCSIAVGMIHVTGDVSCGKNFVITVLILYIVSLYVRVVYMQV